MRTVVNRPRRPSFRLGLTPSAQTSYNTAAQSAQGLINALLDQLSATEPEIQAQWMPRADAVQAELDALNLAAQAAEDSGLNDLVAGVGQVHARATQLASEWARFARGNSPLGVAQQGWIYGAAAVGIGLAAGFAWIAFSKRS